MTDKGPSLAERLAAHNAKGMQEEESTASLTQPGMQTLAKILKPLSRHYHSSNVEELIVCNPQQVFLRTRERKKKHEIWTARQDRRIDMHYMDLVLHAVANIYSIEFDGAKQPTISATIPGGHRFTAVRGQSVVYDEQTSEGGVVLSIRTGTSGAFKHSLSDWSITEDITIAEANKAAVDEVRTTAPAPNLDDSLQDTLIKAATAGRPIMISGATGTGKTALLNVLLAGLDKNLRVVTVEDVRELTVKNPNRTHLMMDRTATENEFSSRGLNPRQMVDSVVRLTPDVLALSEISTQNASMAIQLLMTGHSHFWCTIHAGNCEEAFESWAKRVILGGSDEDSKDIIAILKKRMIVLQLKDIAGQRKLVEAYWPENLNASSDPVTAETQEAGMPG